MDDVTCPWERQRISIGTVCELWPALQSFTFLLYFVCSSFFSITNDLILTLPLFPVLAISLSSILSFQKSACLDSNLFHIMICLIYFSAAASPRFLSYSLLHPVDYFAIITQCDQPCHPIFCLIYNQFFFPDIHVFWCFPPFYHAVSSRSASSQLQARRVWKNMISL